MAETLHYTVNPTKHSLIRFQVVFDAYFWGKNKVKQRKTNPQNQNPLKNP